MHRLNDSMISWNIHLSLSFPNRRMSHFDRKSLNHKQTYSLIFNRIVKTFQFGNEIALRLYGVLASISQPNSRPRAFPYLDNSLDFRIIIPEFMELNYFRILTEYLLIPRKLRYYIQIENLDSYNGSLIM